MTKFLQKMRKGKKGFTLIELLVVIAILGVIAAVAVPNILSFMGSGDVAAAQAEKHNVQVAVSAFMLDNDGTVPDAIPADIASYMIGGSGSIRGTYTIDTDGAITLTAFPGLDDTELAEVN